MVQYLLFLVYKFKKNVFCIKVSIKVEKQFVFINKNTIQNLINIHASHKSNVINICQVRYIELSYSFLTTQIIICN